MSGGGSPECCANADVAVGANWWNTGGVKKVGTSTQEGKNNWPGSNTINGFYPLANDVSPELIPLSRNVVHKSGRTTGTTTGEVASPCFTEVATMPWPNEFTTRNFTVICAGVVVNARIGLGDSGGPVFARLVDGGPYYALGIVSSGTVPLAGGTGWCIAGCAYLFSRWNKIEERLGLGTIHP